MGGEMWLRVGLCALGRFVQQGVGIQGGVVKNWREMKDRSFELRLTQALRLVLFAPFCQLSEKEREN